MEGTLTPPLPSLNGYRRPPCEGTGTYRRAAACPSRVATSRSFATIFSTYSRRRGGLARPWCQILHPAWCPEFFGRVRCCHPSTSVPRAHGISAHLGLNPCKTNRSSLGRLARADRADSLQRKRRSPTVRSQRARRATQHPQQEHTIQHRPGAPVKRPLSVSSSDRQSGRFASLSPAWPAQALMILLGPCERASWRSACPRSGTHVRRRDRSRRPNGSFDDHHDMLGHAASRPVSGTEAISRS